MSCMSPEPFLLVASQDKGLLCDVPMNMKAYSSGIGNSSSQLKQLIFNQGDVNHWIEGFDP